MAQQGDDSPPCDVPLGQPIPMDEHACSVSLPNWSDVVGYEEGDPRVTSELACGYPRFVYHPYVVKLMETALKIDAASPPTGDARASEELLLSPRPPHEPEYDCIVLPSARAANRARDFLLRACYGIDDDRTGLGVGIHNDRVLVSADNAIDEDVPLDGNAAGISTITSTGSVRVLDLGVPSDVHAVIFPAETDLAIAAKSYWQHTGEVVSSRRAEAALVELGVVDSLPRVTSRFVPDGALGLDDKNGADHDDSMAVAILETPYRMPASTMECLTTGQRYMSLYPATTTAASAMALTPEGYPDDPKLELKRRIGSITGTSPEAVFLYPSGMASIYAALRCARRRRLLELTGCRNGGTPGDERGGTAVVYGFPYLDTLKLCGRPEICPDGVEFFGNGDETDLAKLESMLERRAMARRMTGVNSLHGDGASYDAGICALITEFPSNPLLNCHDMVRLRQLADRFNFLLVVDDTIGNFANVDLIGTGIADVVCTSLTKLFNGRGDAMGGSVVVNRATRWGTWILEDLMRTHHHGGADNEIAKAPNREDDLFHTDAMAMWKNSEDFLHRSSVINETAEDLADWLFLHEDVRTVYYPKFTQRDMYDRLLNTSLQGRHTPGYGGLMSILLESHVCQRRFYDTLGLFKGPSLGTNFTLVCPYTLLAHYHELEFARAYNVYPNLIRVAVGLEGFGYIRDKFDRALRQSRLYPKLKPETVADKSMTKRLSDGDRRGYCTKAFVRTTRPLKIGFGSRLHTHMLLGRGKSLAPLYATASLLLPKLRRW